MSLTQRSTRKLGRTTPIRPLTPLHVTQRLLVGIVPSSSKHSDWTAITHYLTRTKAPFWRQTNVNQPWICAAITAHDQKCQRNLTVQIGRYNALLRVGISYPWSSLKQLAEELFPQAPQYTLFQLLTLDPLLTTIPGIYLLSHNNQIIYIGQTSQSLVARTQGHVKSENKTGFMDYVRFYSLSSCTWKASLLSLQQCEILAIQGQLTPDDGQDQDTHHASWALDVAEAALIAAYHPHFNIIRNLFPSPLHDTRYCTHFQHCQS
jgi:hypothetical protein